MHGEAGRKASAPLWGSSNMPAKAVLPIVLAAAVSLAAGEPPTPPAAPVSRAAPKARSAGRDPLGQARAASASARRAASRKPGTWIDVDGDDTAASLTGADKLDQEDRQELRDWRRFGGEAAQSR